MTINASLTIAKVTRIKSGIMINVDVSAKIQKNIRQAKKIISGILLHVVVKIVDMQEVLIAIC